MVGEEKLIDVLEPTGWRLERINRSEGANYIAILAKKS